MELIDVFNKPVKIVNMDEKGLQFVIKTRDYVTYIYNKAHVLGGPY